VGTRHQPQLLPLLDTLRCSCADAAYVEYHPQPLLPLSTPPVPAALLLLPLLSMLPVPAPAPQPLLLLVQSVAVTQDLP
jgi:hypothetical protein